MIVALIQARMGSTRLPRKVLMEINGKPVLWHIFHRLSKSKLIDKTVIATSDDKSCDPIAQFAIREGIPFYRGSEEDLLDRLYQAAKIFHAKDVIRITGDCPIVDPMAVDDLIRFYKAGKYDFAANNHVPTYPHGLDAEIFSFRILEEAWKSVTDPKMRAFATFCLYHRHPTNKVGNMTYKDDLHHLRLTLDYEEDMRLLREIFSRLQPKKDVFLLDDILKLLQEHPEISHINDMHKGHHRLKDMESYLYSRTKPIEH